MRTGRIRHVIAVAAVLALSALLVACARGVVQSDTVDINLQAVTERDVEVARQMGLPDDVLEAMEAGEWAYQSDRVSVRYAELAVDHMAEAHGQRCRVVRASAPWVLDAGSEVALEVVGGEFDGAEVAVRVSGRGPFEYEDTWEGVARASEYEALVGSALAEALSGLPEGSWAAEAFISERRTTEDALAGSVNVYLAPDAAQTGERLGELCEGIEASLSETGCETSYYVVVCAREPEGGVMTAELGLAAALEDGDAVLFRANGEVGVDEA